MNFINHLLDCNNNLSLDTNYLSNDILKFKQQNSNSLKNKITKSSELKSELKENYSYLNNLPVDFTLPNPIKLHQQVNNMDKELENSYRLLIQDYATENQNKLIFIDGILSEKLSYLNTEELFHSKSQKLPSLDEEEAKTEKHLFSLINNCLFQEYINLKVKPNITLKDSLVIVHFYNGEKETAPVYHNRLLIEVGENTHLEIQEIYQSINQGNTYACNIDTTIHLEQTSTLKHYLLQKHHLNNYHFVNTKLIIKKSAEYKSFLYQVGSRVSSHRQNIKLKDIHSKTDLAGIYLVNPKQLLQNLIHIEHLVSDCNSSQLFKGILKDYAKANFTGKVSVNTDSTNTISNQINRNILLGDNSYAESRPQLEINNDDVKCSHGSTTGRLNPLEVFYLCSRGIPKQKALSLLSFAFINECLLQIENQKLKEKVTTDAQTFFEDIQN